jgi:hypothetical protein
MEEPPLSGLVPDDPQNRLSKSARQRVMRARLECDRIRWEAQANVDARHLSDVKARYVLNQADLKGARTVLKVLSAEYADAGFSLREFWAAMRDEIDGVSNSFSLYGSQRRLLETEFHLPAEHKARPRPRSTLTRSVSSQADSVGAQINRLREECHLTEEELAEKIEMDIRSVQRHLTNETTPYARHLRVYERMFSNLLKRQVVIRKMP